MMIRVKAGKNVLELVRSGGFSFDMVTTYVGPAVGPRWLLASGFDLTLMEQNLLGRKYPVLLAGSSAGAFRFAAWLQPEPMKSYRTLIDSYCAIDYTRKDTPQIVRESIGWVLDSYLEDDAIPFALSSKRFRFSVMTARAKNLAALETVWLQKLGLYFAFVANSTTSVFLNAFFEPVVFYYAPLPPRFCLNSGFSGRAIAFNEANFKPAVLASGAIPTVVAGVCDIFGAPDGIYRDGGLFHYHLNCEYAGKPGEVTLMFHHQRQIVPGWLDKTLKKRAVGAEFLDNLLMVFPTERFIETLPGKKVPDRDDFVTLVDEPAQRMANWREAVKKAEPLGLEFLEMIESGRIRERVETFQT